MGDLKQGVDVVEVYLPEPEDVDGLGVEGGEIDGVGLEPEEDVVVVSGTAPGFVDCVFEGKRKGRLFVVVGSLGDARRKG